MYKEYNAHPKGLKTTDCVVRAIATAMDKDYLECRRELNQAKRKLRFGGYKETKFLYKYLENYPRLIFKAIKGEPRLKGSDFTELHPVGIYILKMAGHRRLFRPTLKALLREPLKKKGGLTLFLRCRLISEEGKLYASTTGEQGSGILSSMVKAQGLIVLPREAQLVPAGSEVNVILLDPMFFYSCIPEYLSSSSPA